MARRIPFHETDGIIRCLEEDGGAIITGFTSLEDLEKVTADARPYLDEIAEERRSKGIEQGTRRCFRLFGKSETAREKWLQDPGFLKIIRYFLSTTSVPYNDHQGETIVTDPILSVAATMEVCPGQIAQGLHRDDFIWQTTHDQKSEPKYQVGRDVSMGVLVPAVETTVENGATEYVLGSHLWPHSRRPQPEEVSYATMVPGEAFIFLGSTVHAGGANKSTQDRPVHGFFYCRSFMRPEENQFLWWTKEEVETWSVAARKQAGYVMDSPYIGHGNETNPIDQFRAQAKLQSIAAA